jgi:AraC-like DNA-binding protein
MNLYHACFASWFGAMSSRQDFGATVRLIAPRFLLTSCVRAYIARSTVGVPLLPAEQRVNRFPATMHCGIAWFIRGSTRIVRPHRGDPLPRALFVGPRTRPVTSYNPGPVHMFMVVFFPQALHALTGIDLSRVVNEVMPLPSVLDGAWLDLSAQVMAASNDDERVLLIERFLEPMWRSARHREVDRGGVIADGVRALAVHAAASGWGRSARRLERRIKAWAGQPLRVLRRMGRVEQTFLQSRDAIRAGGASWADIAAHGGYADQPHLCREVREFTGLGPSELARKASEDESYWVYRIWSWS